MPCLVDGQPVCTTTDPVDAVRYRENAEAVATNTESIAINFVAPAELQMEQLTAHWGGVPTTSESIVLTKISVETGARYDTVLRSVDPSVGAEYITDLVCVIPFRFAAGDTVQITYPNSDDQDVGVEIMLLEV